MNQRERNFWSNIRKNTPQRDFWCQRIENGLVIGMPDVHMTHRHTGRQSWVELKAVEKYPVRPTTPVLDKGDMRIAQINWHMKAATMRVPTFIAARIERDMFVVPGPNAAHLESWIAADWEVYKIQGWEAFWEKFK
jgi:hypothetical protein